jgi:glyoxylase-like metal-dependent hydrolase (beta-lactamase superfamily II)
MAVDIPFNRALEFEYGKAAAVSPLIRRIVARNPGAFTFHGTGTYVVGRGKVAVIDPGPALKAHLDAIVAALRGETVTHIVVTHTHLDHSPLARPLQKICGAPIYGFGPHGAGRYEADAKVEEGGDTEFAPDIRVADGDAIAGEGWSLAAVHTPGHTSNHLCFALREEKALFSGDHVMGWSTSVISPPDGDMRAYKASLKRLIDRDDTIYWPTHGGPIREPQAFVAKFIAHREERERQILACLGNGVARIRDMVPRIYGGTIAPLLYPAAARSVFAHMIDLVERGVVAAEGELRIDAEFRLNR